MRTHGYFLKPKGVRERKSLGNTGLEDTTVRCQPEDQMTYELNRRWLAVVWKRRLGVFQRKCGMLVLYAFKGHLIPEIKPTISSTNKNHQV